MKECSSCKKKTTNRVDFTCPSCKKEISRCNRCRSLSIGYKCSKCNHEGP